MEAGMSSHQSSSVTMAVPTGLMVTTTIFSSISLIVWGTSIGFMFGWGYDFYHDPALAIIRVHIGIWFSIPANAALIYTACRLIFLVNDRSFPGAMTLYDLQQCVSRMVAFTVLAFTGWVCSLVWLTVDGDHEAYVVYHACNYGFIMGIVVAGLAGGLLSNVTTRTSNSLPVHAVPSKYISQQQQDAHYNPAYVHYRHQRV